MATPSNTLTPMPDITITWVGDMAFGRPGIYPAAGPASLFTDVKDKLASDVTIGNLETVIGTVPLNSCGAVTTCFHFEAQPQTAQVLKDIGFAVVNTANNHSHDAGAAGVTSTHNALTAAGVAWTGQPGQITQLDVNGVSVAVIGFAPYDHSADARDIPASAQLVAQAKQQADLVIVVMHLGAEGTGAQHVRPGTEYFVGENRGDSIAFSHAVIDAGADLVVGSGPHVLRAMQWYNGHLIAYSMGNFMGYHNFAIGPTLSQSGILQVTLDSDGHFSAGNVTPVFIKAPGTPTIDPAGKSITTINKLSQADFAGNGAVTINTDGSIQPPD